MINTMDRYAQAEKDRQQNNKNPETEWQPTDIETSPKAYKNQNNNLLYIDDTYQTGRNQTQTTIQDWNTDRYAVKLRKNNYSKEKTIHTTMNWHEAEALLELKAGDLQNK